MQAMLSLRVGSIGVHIGGSLGLLLRLEYFHLEVFSLVCRNSSIRAYKIVTHPSQMTYVCGSELLDVGVQIFD
jgi:hypothetical protein